MAEWGLCGLATRRIQLLAFRMRPRASLTAVRLVSHRCHLHSLERAGEAIRMRRQPFDWPLRGWGKGNPWSNPYWYFSTFGKETVAELPVPIFHSAPSASHGVRPSSLYLHSDR
ncbi:hypothetical protein B296_00002459 [Ensete ventricosum]|uniref:Uncharacterized protein n=1 Tax=Ensete ventricosum TaxID=4639 RepID=A0A427BCD7_ENSVE|nr:hypothetical protein B296_00002459 [Ensete ventricosum]